LAFGGIGLSITSASGWPRLAPVTQQASTDACMTSRSSIGAGATYLPLLVLKRSFTRPVILRLPSASSAPLSPVLQPAVGGEAFRRQLGLLVVAEHRPPRLDLDLAVGRVDAALHAVVGAAHGAGPACRHGDVAGAQFSVMP
jgi:hypothetical protein